jgi:ABC-2 type transport system permease protein
VAVRSPGAAAGNVAPARRVRARHFIGLKLRVLRNGLRGQRSRIVLFVVGVLFGLWSAFGGFGLFTLSAADDRASVLVPAFGGALLTLGWLFLPLVFFGVDETLEPGRFALLPVPRRTLVAGLLAAALLGVPAVATLLATAGLVVGAAVHGGAAAAGVQAVGVLAGLVLCVTTSRAITSAFASMLRSRRTRDLAAVALAVLAALLGPLQFGVLAAAERADLELLTRYARVVGWTPLAAPYTAGFEVAEGRPAAAVVKLALTGVTVAALLWWWSSTLESAMSGSVSGGATRATRSRRSPGGAVDQLFPRPLGFHARNRPGALIARETRYWWRDARRRSSLITFVVVGVFLPVAMSLGARGLLDGGSGINGGSGITGTPGTVTASMLFVGTLAALALANQFGFDGSAYAAHIVAGVPGRCELRARALAYSIYIVPLMTVIATVVTFVLGGPARLPVLLGALYAAYGTGLGVVMFVSVLGAYALPDTPNPFAVNTGAGVAKGLLSLAALAGSLAAAMPYAMGSALAGDAWRWFALPVGLGYGLAAAALGCYLAGDVLDRRAPELLAAVTPRR